MKTSQDNHYADDDNFSEENDEDENSQNSGGGDSGGNRWDKIEQEQMDYVCTFLDNEEDNLPEFFDAKQIKKDNSDRCSHCDKEFSTLFTAKAKSKRHHCRRCGVSVCLLCSSSPKRRLSKLDKKKYRVCDTCDTLMSNVNFESMYVNCLQQQEVTLKEVKHNISKRDLQVKQINTQLDKYKKTLESKLKEIGDKESHKKQILQDKEDLMQSKQQEYNELRDKLDSLEKEITLKDREIEEMQRQKDKMREQKKKVEEERIKKESELKDQNQKLHQVIEEEYANSFEDNQVAEVEDVNDRFDWRDEDTSYEESYSVFIEKARQLKAVDGTVDPLVEVKVLDQKKYSSSKDNIGSGMISWNEHLFFEPKNLSVEQIEQAKIQIRVLDKGFFKDSVIGCYDFDATFIYFQKKHSMLHKWVALSNPYSQNVNEVQGYLKLSISVSAAGDEQIQISEDHSNSGDDQIMMPPSIRPEYHQITFRFFRAENLPAMDKNLLGKGGSIDAYIICNYLGNSLKTDTITANEGVAVDWNCEFLIPCQMPIMSNRIVMKLFDKDLVNDEIVGSMLFNLNDCMGPLNGKYFWKNIYGSPLDCSGKNTDLMNANPDIASTWKGRILMQVVAEKTQKPQCLKRPIDGEVIKAVQQAIQPKEYEVIAEIGQGISLPDNEKYTVMIKIADFVIKTDKPVTQEGNYNRWSYRFKQAIYKSPYQDISDIGRYYVYLMQGDKAICYYRGSIDSILDPNPSYKWIEMTNDLAVGKVKNSYEAGLLSIKLAINDKSKNGPINFEEFDAWKKPPPKRLNIVKVRAFIYQCRDLPSADSDGQSDCFVHIWDSSKDQKKTVVIENSNNPIFFQPLEFTLETNKLEDLPPFVLDIYDQDALSSDFIARSIIPLKDAHYTEEDIVPEPKWHPCRIKASDPACGEILVSFAIVESDYTFKVPLNYMNLKEYVEYSEFHIDINLLGLRNLQSVGILPVKKAFIIFNLKSLVPPSDGRAIDNVKTQPGPAGPNPTINTQIKIRLPLPRSPLYCPKLSCTVHDYIFKGLSQPQIGAFTIPIGEIIHKIIKEKLEETHEIEMIIEELDKIISNKPAIQSYSIQKSISTESKVQETEEIKEESAYPPMRSSLNDDNPLKTKQENSIRKSMKIDDEMKKPLLQKVSQDNVNVLELSRTSGEQNQSAYQLMQRKFTASGVRKSEGKNDQKTKLKDALKQKALNQQLASEMKDQVKEQLENDQKAKREFEYQREREMEEFKRQSGGGAFKNVIMPTYDLDKRLQVHREVNPPPDSVFIGLGWDENPKSMKRHYRRYYHEELEKIKEIFPKESPFDTYKIMKGQSRGASKGWFSFGNQREDESGEVSDEQVVGMFKGLVSVYSDDDSHRYQEYKNQLIHDLKMKLNTISLKKTMKPLVINIEKKLDTMEGRQKFDMALQNLGVGHLNITKKLQNLEQEEILKRLLLQQTKCMVRVYIIGAFNLSSRDNGSDSDPYLVMKLGNRVYNERNIYQEDEPNPEFNKYYEFESFFPGCPPLQIDIFDYDDIFGDDVIGTTVIDLEDRFFSPEWMSIKHKPIEFRSLSHPSTSISQGTVKMWVEIHPTAIPASEITIWDLTPKPAEEFEIRFIVYDTLDIKCMDVEGTSDVFFKAFFDQKIEVKETDTHYRCSNGKASFNYRMLMKMTHPRKDYMLTLQAFDRDFFKSNDIIGDIQIDLAQAIQDCALTKRPLSVNKTYYNNYLKAQGAEFTYKDESSFYVPLRSYDDDGKPVTNGKVRIQIDIYPQAAASANKVGEARQEPNHSPFLAPPIGRISFTMNPFKMFNQLVGPALRRKIYCYCCLALCCTLCIMLAPLIIGDLISAGFEKLIGLR